MDLPNPGMEPGSPELQANSLYQGSPFNTERASKPAKFSLLTKMEREWESYIMIVASIH